MSSSSTSSNAIPSKEISKRDYYIVERYLAEDLSDSITEWLNEGYNLHGNLILTKDKFGNTIYIQAIVRL